MKKYLISIIVILASVTSIYAFNELFNSNLSLDRITQINVYYKDQLKDSYTPKKNESSDYDLQYTTLIDALNQMKKIDSKSTIASNYKLDLIAKGELKSYNIHIDSNNRNIFVSHLNQNSNQNDFYFLSNESINKILDLTFFDEIYYEDTILDYTFMINEKALSPNINGIVSYTTPKDSKFEKKLSYNMGNTVTKVDDYNNQNTILLNFSSPPKSISLKAYDGEQLLEEKIAIEDNITLLKRDGITSYKVMVEWKNGDGANFDGNLTYSFDVDMDLAPEFELVENNKGAGEFFVIKALNFNDDEKPLVISDSIRNKHFEKIGDEYLLIIPLNYYQKKAVYNIDLYVRKNDHDSLIETKKLIVENRDFTSQRLTIDKSTVAATSNDNAYAEFGKYFTPSREKSNPKAYFSEAFILPIDGRISTQFGMMRYVNGSLTSYRHSGLDIAVPRGTPVPATNAGKVVLSMELILTGNTVVIDHGVGIFSVYYHMDTLNVKKDDMLERADIIGTVGSTGRSTGPHLHFTTSFYKTNMNPNFLINLSENELENLIK